MNNRIKCWAFLVPLVFVARAEAHVPYVKVEGGGSFAESAGLKDDNPGSADCVLQPAGAGSCTGTLDDLGTASHFSFSGGLKFRYGISTELTYSHRSGYELKGRDEGGTDFDPRVTADTVMFNVQYLVPWVFTSWNIQPLVNVGVGASHNRMATIHWNDGATQGVLPGGSTTSFAWSVGAGARAPVPGVKGLFASLGYRYVDLGQIKKDFGPDVSGAGFSASGNTGSMTGDLTAHEFFIGVTYEFDTVLHIFDRIFQ